MPIFDPDSDVETGPEIDGAPPEPELEVDEIQGNIMPGFNSLAQGFLGVRWGRRSTAAARAGVGARAPVISTLRQVNDHRNVRRRALRQGGERPPSPVWTNIAFDMEGLRLLGLPVDGIADESFAGGLGAGASRALGDPVDREAEGHVSRWRVGGLEERTPQAFLIVGADEPAAVEVALARIRATVDRAGGRVVYHETGRVLPDSREHFGFRDGISTVAPRGRLSAGERHYLSRRYVDPGDPRALRFAKPGQALVWPGQFVFGYPGQHAADPVAAGLARDGGEEWMRNGSLLVFRRLRQDVPAFRRFVAREARRLAREPGFGRITPELFAAMLVGRWPNGTSLTIKATTPARAPMNDRLRVNHFGFAGTTGPIGVSSDRYIKVEEGFVREAPEIRNVPGARRDPDGVRCPKFAHVRKVNPRDIVTDLGPSPRTLTLQVMRRGITFGDAYPDDEAAQPDDDGDRGLLFLCYQTSIADQFEQMTVKWMNRPLGPEGDAGHDLLVGQSHGASGARTATLRSRTGEEAAVVAAEDWVIPTGGGYFMSPSLSTLRSMAGS